MKSQVYTNNAGVRTRQTWSRVNNPPGWNCVTSYQTGQPISSDSLSVSNGNVKGDFKSANPISFSRVRYSRGSGYQFAGDPLYGYIEDWGHGIALPSPSGLTPISTSYDFNILYNRALDKLTEQVRGGIDLSVDFAQGAQTWKMVRDSYKLVNFVRSLSVAKWSERWLEYQYGWKPLLGSIYGVAALFGSCVKDEVATFKVRVSEHKEKSTSFDRGAPSLVDTFTEDFNARLEIKIRLKLKPSTLDNLAKLTSLNPASIVWELCPYSFVADWLVDIGGYLRNLETALLYDLQFQSGYVTQGYLYNRAGRRGGNQITGTNPLSYTFASGSDHYRSTYKNRAVLLNYPTPVSPSVELDLGSSRITSAVGLIHQHWAKGLRK